ncbi:MAG: energy transducer TonB [Acidobacteria bacterium]|nr:MAG: energy transducer TonB [Acidobacteriota bacterium]
MSSFKGFFLKTKDFLERLLALKATESERSFAGGYGFADDAFSSRRPTQVAVIIALLFHAVLFVIMFPSWGQRVFRPSEQVLVLRQLAPAGGGSRPKMAPPKVAPVLPKPEPIFVPIPDPTPNDPEPLRRTEVLEVPKVVHEINADLSIGDIDAPPGPPGPGGQGAGTGTGLATGPGGGSGPPGDGVYEYGTPGIVDPQILVQTIPSYTDEAIKAKVQGVVLLQAIIRKNGRVDSPVVLRGLGYGLEEKAIREIVANWRFKPAMLNGRAVDLQATIEVTFNLR